MTAADGGECNIQKQSRAKKASSRREQLLTDSAGEEKIVSKKCILMLHPRRSGQNSRRNASSFTSFQAARCKEK
ncbi:FIG00732595: hypothetical protein [Klebsiella pneumoniae IS53]|nr:FIG00732595: hypothetical protein [Klebsiella pneumoniae IS53]